MDWVEAEDKSAPLRGVGLLTFLVMFGEKVGLSKL